MTASTIATTTGAGRVTERVNGRGAKQYGEASALTMVSLVPALFLGILVQRHLVRGLTLGAVQG